MNPVLAWIRANVYTVIFVGIMIVAPVALVLFAAGENADVQQEVKRRAGRLSDLKKIESTQVSLTNPVQGNRPVSESILVNPRFLDRYREVVGRISEDAERVHAEALAFNRDEHGRLLPELLPEPPMHRIETLPGEMHRAVVGAYEQMLQEVDAGTPPAAESMREELEAARERFTTQILIKEGGAQLTEEEQDWLAEQLVKTRLSRYAEAAKSVGVYADLAVLDVPPEASIPVRAEGPGMIDIYDWQWQLWIKRDILRGVAAANEQAQSVLEGPVKRIVWLSVLDGPTPGGYGGTSGGTGFSPGVPGGRRPAGGGAGGGSPVGGPPNPVAEVRPDYTASFTGRTDNQLYDVRFVELVIIVDSTRIPEVLDALSRQNFITVLDTRLADLDLFEEARSGYFYGGGQISSLTLTLETIWMREWTKEIMPAEMKEALGIPTATSGG